MCNIHKKILNKLYLSKVETTYASKSLLICSNVTGKSSFIVEEGPNNQPDS